MKLTQLTIARFWAPLASTWLMMALEGPILAAVVARLAEPEFNLAAYGVALALAILIEAPVIMLMSAATSLARDRASFLRLRRFAWGLCAGTTLILLVILIPSVHELLMRRLIGLPDPIADLTYGALWCFLPWPAAIGFRRLYQGLLIRARQTHLVARGTLIRLFSLSLAAGCGYLWVDLPGAWIAPAALSVAVVCEAVAARLMVRPALRELLSNSGRRRRRAATPMSYREIAHFYFPLLLTPVIGMAMQPMLAFFMGRSVSPIESLAVFPVVNSVGFFFRSISIAYQDVAIALMGRRFRHFVKLRTFAITLGSVTAAGLAAVAFVHPVSHLWFVTVSGLTVELEGFAIDATRVMFPIPFLATVLSLQRAILLEGRRTGPITAASAVELAVVGVSFIVFGWGIGMVGATAAFAATLCGRLAANAYLLRPCESALSTGRAGR